MRTLRVFAVAAAATIAAACSLTPSRPPVSPVPTPAPAVTQQLSGTWVLTVESPMGTRDTDAVFTQNGEALSGKIISSRGEVPLTGSVTGNAVAFGISINAQGQDLQIDYAGTVTGDTMSGTVQFGSFGDGKWSGKKKGT